MLLIVNGRQVDPDWIRQEIHRMRPSYEQTFSDQSPEEREGTLLDWAKENVIEHVLLRSHAMEDPRPIPPMELKEATERLKTRYQGTQGGQSWTNEEFLRQQAESELRWQRLLDELAPDDPNPSEEEISAFYAEQSEEFKLPERVLAAHIVKHVDDTTSEEEARAAMDAVQKRLDEGTEFETLADEMSDCPGQGGSLGWFPRGQMVQEFEDVVFGMDPGTVSPIFQTGFGFHIAKLYEKRASEMPPLEEIRDQVKEALLQKRRDEKTEALVDRLRSEASVLFLPQEDIKPLNSLLIKPAGPDCNMACGYCFYLEKASLFNETSTHRMSEETLEEMIRQAMTQAGLHISFGWQGGEPTLMGLPFFEKAVAFQEKYGRGQSVGNGLQTNGLLIDEDWAAFLKRNEFLVGLSLDGPQHVHDRYRRTKGGQGTWEKVSSVARLLLDEGVATNALSVVNEYSVQFPAEIYGTLKEMGFRFLQFIPCVEEDPKQPGRAAPFSVEPERFGQFLVEIFDLWRKDFKNGEPTVSVRFMDSVFHTYVDLPPPECTLTETCGIYVVVEHNGNVYSCDFFVEPRWKLGNVMEDHLIEMLNSPRQEAFGKMKSNLPEPCMSCAWLKHCRGGCTKDRVKDERDNRISHFCQSYKMFFEHADPFFKRLATEWTAKQTREAQRAQVQERIQRGDIQVGRNDPCPCGSGLKYKKCCMPAER